MFLLEQSTMPPNIPLFGRNSTGRKNGRDRYFGQHKFEWKTEGKACV